MTQNYPGKYKRAEHFGIKQTLSRCLNRPGPVGIFEDLKPGDVLGFRCPCRQRVVFITSPPHKWSFDQVNGDLTIEGSVGYHKRHDKPRNWCHFRIKDGEFTMCDDAVCPGADPD